MVTFLAEQNWTVDDIGLLISATPLAKKYQYEGKNRLRQEIERAISKSRPNPQGGQQRSSADPFQLEFNALA